MTAPVVHEFDRDIPVADRGFHPAGADGDFLASHAITALNGQLWSRIAEGKRRDG
jgi:hypothetical protein